MFGDSKIFTEMGSARPHVDTPEYGPTTGNPLW